MSEDRTESRLEVIRNWMCDNELDAYIVPHDDEFLNEYVPRQNERLASCTGFTGSAGAAVILKDRAAIFVDGRYTVQVRQQVRADLFEYLHLVSEPVYKWLLQNCPAGSRAGFDPRLHNVVWYEDTVKKLLPEITLIALEENPIELAWNDRPKATPQPAWVHDQQFNDRSHAEKRQRVCRCLQEKHCDLLVLSDSESINWLLNIRGGDLPATPVMFGYAICFADSRLSLFCHPEQIGKDVRAHLGDEIRIFSIDALVDELDKSVADKYVWLDPAKTTAAIQLRLQDKGASIHSAEHPVITMKAAKTESEINHIQEAHRRDGVALSRFLCWLDQTLPERPVGELEAAAKLDALRREQTYYCSASFETITAAGANAAMCHYRADEISERILNDGAIYLVDSGGQYLDGTTDVTRTVLTGDADDEIKTNYTRVLKGHISLACAIFPDGTCGQQLDVLARQALWQYGLDFDHGTGHGVGYCLGVHEGPQRIAGRGPAVPLRIGMVVSNEPGYYQADAYGIRIENLVYVAKNESLSENGHDFLQLNTLTLAPIDKRLIYPGLLNEREVLWLNNYHARVYKELSAHLNPLEKDWLQSATSPL